MESNTTFRFRIACVCLGLCLCMASVQAQWSLVWQDEFDGTTLDGSKWVAIDNCGDKRNNEQQCYMASAVTVGDGELTLTGTKEPQGSFQYTSGAVTTRGKFTQAYGRFEWRAKMPQGGQGVWPALWMYPPNQWPPEIDVLEAVNDMSRIYFTYHWDDGGHKSSGGNTTITNPGDWHIYACEWEVGEIRWYIDGDLKRTHTNANVTDIPMRLYINLALGGAWPGSVGSSTVFPQVMKVDYVRVYQKGQPTEPLIQLSPTTLAVSAEKGTNPADMDVTVTNVGAGTLADATTLVVYRSGTGWLEVSRSGSGNDQKLTNTVSSASLAVGTYEAEATVGAGSAPTASYTVRLTVAGARDPDDPGATTAGLSYEYFEGSWSSLPDFASLSPASTGIAATIGVSPAVAADNFALRFVGYIEVPTNGLYTFYTRSDDGSRLLIGDAVVVDNDGLHAEKEASGQTMLRAGQHAITVEYFEATGGQVLSASWEGPGITRESVPASALSHSDGVTALARFSAGRTRPPMALARSEAGLRVMVAVDGAYTLNVLDCTGRRVAAHTGWGRSTVELENAHLPVGTYVLALRSAKSGTTVNVSLRTVQ